MNRKISFAPGEFYHLYNRGNDKRTIFLNDFDYIRFIYLLFFCNGSNKIEMKNYINRLRQGETLGRLAFIRGDTLVDIGAFCLMPNHFHILVREKEENGITSFMKKLCTAYSMYFNIKNKRTGKLFEGAFKAEHADTDEYLKYLFSYIHLNPAKLIDPDWRENAAADSQKIRDFVEKYRYSSYRNYLDHKENAELLNQEAFPDYFSDRGIKEEVADWLSFNQDAEVSPRDGQVGEHG